jgi:hypothetical protein
VVIVRETYFDWVIRFEYVCEKSISGSDNFSSARYREKMIPEGSRRVVVFRRRGGVIPERGKTIFGRMRGNEKLRWRMDQNQLVRKKPPIRESSERNQNGIKAGEAGCFCENSYNQV